LAESYWNLKDWAPVPLQAYCTSWTLSAVLAPGAVCRKTPIRVSVEDAEQVCQVLPVESGVALLGELTQARPGAGH
jgi:hypothetical protein